MKTALLLALFAAWSVPVRGATALTGCHDSTGSVRIETNPAGADAFLDSTYLGSTPLELAGIAEGAHAVRIVAPSLDAWQRAVWEDSVTVRRQEGVIIRRNIVPPLLVDTRPQGAAVVVDGRMVGTTPVIFADPSRPVSVRLSKAGFDSVDVDLPVLFSMPVIPLRPVGGDPSFAKGEARPSWITYASGAGMLLSGMLTAVLKDRANRSFDDYLRTNDPASLDATRRYDRLSTAALIVTQISFCALSYLLLWDS